jgi:hypothetical protein
VYFESDQIIYPGEEIYIGLKNSSTSMQNSKDRFRVEIKWRKDLQNASFRYGYGAVLIYPINRLVKSLQTSNPRPKNTRRDVTIRAVDPRNHKRKPYRKMTFFASKRKTYKGLITNLSRGGAHIKTRNKLYLGQLIRLVIPGDKDKKDVKLKGWVVRLSPEGIGVRFDRRTGRDRRSVLDRRGSPGSKAKEHNHK